MKKFIKGYNNRYIAKSDGEIYDIKHKRNVCQWVDNVGYKQCILFVDGKRNYHRTHRVLAKTLLPNPDNLPQVNHKNGNKGDNCLDNLEWTTNKENTKHGYDNNLYQYHERSHKINVYDLDDNFLTQYPSIRQTATNLGLNRKTITSILKKEKENNYPYKFRYANESVETIESVS